METQWIGINGENYSSELKEQKQKKRFPCYLYLNGGCLDFNNGTKLFSISFNFLIFYILIILFF